MKKYINEQINKIKIKLRPIIKPLIYILMAILDKIQNVLYKLHRFIKKPSLPDNKDKKILIHLGCGNENDSRYINVDALVLPHIHYVSMVEKLPMFSKNYADLVYASHVLEHISHKQTITVLKEWKRILKPGGIIRISVPDFDKIINIYQEENRNIQSIISPLMGEQDYTFNFHKSMFNEEFIRKMLQDAGFKEIKIWDPNKTDYYNFNDWANKKISNKYPISLNMEGVKY